MKITALALCVLIGTLGVPISMFLLDVFQLISWYGGSTALACWGCWKQLLWEHLINPIQLAVGGLCGLGLYFAVLPYVRLLRGRRHTTGPDRRPPH